MQVVMGTDGFGKSLNQNLSFQQAGTLRFLEIPAFLPSFLSFFLRGNTK